MAIYISNEAQLRAYASNPTDDAILLNDIALIGGDWAPITNMAYSFNGQGHTISNVNVNSTLSGGTGFIANTYLLADGLIIKNLRISGDILTTGTSAGGIVGIQSSTNTQIINCKFTGTVTATNRVGGIVGWISGTATDRIVARNQVDGDIRATDDASVGYVGGIIGRSNITKTICQDNCFYGTLRAGHRGIAGIGRTTGSIVACVARATQVSDIGNYTESYGIASSPSHFVDNHYNSTLFGVHGPGDESTAEFTSISTYQTFGYYDFGTTWQMTVDGPKLIDTADYTFVQKFDPDQDPVPVLVPSTQPTILKFHATKAGDITPTLTFTGGPIEVFTETSQVGPVTNYTSQGTFVSGTPKTISLTLGQRLYFAIPTGTSITALDFTDDQITGTLDSEAIQTFATITLTNSGWRRYYIEKTLEYLDTAGFTGTLTATGTPGIFTDEAIAARTNLIADGATIAVNLAQKGAGTYTFILPFTTTAANQSYGTTITGVTGVTVNIKDSGGTIIHTLNTGTIVQPIAVAGDYTAEWEVTYDGSANTTLLFNTGTAQVHTFDVANIPAQLLANSTNTNMTANGTITGDLSDFSENTKASARLHIMGHYTTDQSDFVGDIGTLTKPDFYLVECQYVPLIYGDATTIARTALQQVAFRGQNKLIGDVDAFKACTGGVTVMLCTGMTGSIQNWKGYNQQITGSSGIQGPVNTTTSGDNTVFNISGSGFTKAQLEESINGLYTRFASFAGGINARGYGVELVIDDPAIVAKVMEFEAKTPANWDIKILLPAETFHTPMNASVGDRFNMTLAPLAAFGNYKVTFPAGAFVRTSDSTPITEWTENTSPDVTCVTAGLHDIVWEVSYDGTSQTTYLNVAGGMTANTLVFDVGDLPAFTRKQGSNYTNQKYVTGSVTAFNDTLGIISLSRSSVSGPITGLTKAQGFYLDDTDVSGPITNCLVNANWQLRNTKLSRTDIEQSLIYLDNRVPLFTGLFICDTGMPGILDPAAITAYTNLVARLGAANIKATLDPMPVPSDEVTRIFCHATKAGMITPKFTFTGGTIEVFAETAQVGPTTLYESRGYMVSDAEFSTILDIGQRIYFEIGIGVSITAMDFTGDQITGTLDSEAIYTEATINLSNSGWRRYYIEKTLEYLDSVNYAGVFYAQDGDMPGIYTDEALTARTNILARATSVVEVNLAQKGAGAYTFTLPFRTDVANRVFNVRIARNNATYITSAVCVIKDEEGNTLYTLDPGAVSNTFTLNQTIPAIGNYTANYTVVLNPTGLATDTASFSVLSPNTVIHTFDIKNIPIPVATAAFYVTYGAKSEIEGDISDCSESIPGGRISLQLSQSLPTLVGDIGTIRARYVFQLMGCENCYGNIENIDWGLEGVQPYLIGFNNMPKLVGDVDAMKNLNYTVNNTGVAGFIACQGVHGSIENWKSASVDIRGSSNITGPINSVVSNYIVSTRRVYGSGFTLEQIEESIDRLYNCGFVYKGSFEARGTGYGPELATSNQTTIDQIESLKAGGANIQVKTIAAVYDFTLAYHGAEAGDVYRISITPTTPFTDYKVTFPAGAFVRADNGNPVTEWTEDMSPNVVCVTPGDYDIRWQFGWDGVSAYAIFNLASAPIASRSKHVFDISQIPDACHTRIVDLNAATNVTGDVSKFVNTSDGISLYGTQNLSGSIASLTQQTFMSLDLRYSSLGGVVAGGAANCAYYFDNSKLTKSDIAKSLIYLNNRDPLCTGNFWCSSNMPAITDKKGIEAYDALVARLGGTKIRVNVDREGGTVPVVSSNRLRPSSLARLQGMRRF